MAKRITSPEEYELVFGESERQNRALEYALDIRKFEIELYWRRATYFWTLIAATFAGYLALASASSKPLLLFLVGCIGLVLSLGWYLVNRGSKYWQTNWERHVDCLEDEFIGPLYKTTISNQQFRFFRFWDGYPYSVSKINQLISLFVFMVWLGIAIASFLTLICPSFMSSDGTWTRVVAWLLGATTILFVGALFWLACGGSQGKPRPVDFYTSDLVPPKDDGAA